MKQHGTWLELERATKAVADLLPRGNDSKEEDRKRKFGRCFPKRILRLLATITCAKERLDQLMRVVAVNNPLATTKGVVECRFNEISLHHAQAFLVLVGANKDWNLLTHWQTQVHDLYRLARHFAHQEVFQWN